MKFSVEAKGFKEFREELEKLGGNFHKAAKRGVKKASNIVKDEADKKAKLNGWSEDIYFFAYEPKFSRKSNTSCLMYIKPLVGKITFTPTKNRAEEYKKMGDRYYVIFPEIGTPTQKAKPALRPALIQNEENTQNIIAEELAKELKKIKKKQGFK